jgi:Ca2+-transporting ATPase
VFKLSCAVNSSALLRTTEANEKGSATELAILKLLAKMNLNYLQLRNLYPALRRFPFNSERKRMSTLVSFEERQILLLKGASEIVMESCSKWMNPATG